MVDIVDQRGERVLDAADEDDDPDQSSARRRTRSATPRPAVCTPIADRNLRARSGPCRRARHSRPRDRSRPCRPSRPISAAPAAPSRPARRSLPACTPIAPTLANGYTTTTCPTTTIGPTASSPARRAARRDQQLHPHRLHRHHAGLAGLQDHDRPGRQPLVHRVQRHADRQVRPRPPSSPPSTVRCRRRRRRSPRVRTATSGSPSAAVDGSTSVLGKITPAGVITEFKTTPVTGSVAAMTGGADGHVWFVKDGFGGPGGRPHRSGDRRVHDLQRGLNGAFTLFGGIALGGDGNVWFTSYYDGLIGRVTPAGRHHRIHRRRAERAAQRDHRRAADRRLEHALGHRPDQQEHRQADPALARPLAPRRRPTCSEACACSRDAERALAQAHRQPVVAAEAKAEALAQDDPRLRRLPLDADPAHGGRRRVPAERAIDEVARRRRAALTLRSPNDSAGSMAPGGAALVDASIDRRAPPRAAAGSRDRRRGQPRASDKR